MELRRATASDADDIGTLVRAAYAGWVPILGREPQPMTCDYTDAVRRHQIDLLYAQAMLIGLIEFDLAEDHLLIVNVAVATAWQGKGAGRRLMTHAERIAAAAGRRILRLYTNKRMVENIRFYSRLGYRIDGEIGFPGGIRVNMSKRLRS